jgi:hypothetical protein
MLFLTSLLLSAAPSSTQERKPVRVDSEDVLLQLSVLIQVDKTLGKPETETFTLVKDVIQLNQAQIDYYDLITPPAPPLAALAKDSTISAFRNMRASICERRPHLTQLVDLDGKRKSCEKK